ncbi:sporulation control protein [Halopelagius longus]|uniref:Sporulation control protein n=1 Tax=Halopelagius longus TaxID=1236180 RepID=A0A1H1FQH0_9EURY|nr:sporulation control protein [Halopelagius longus]RDI69980.1 sporulation control protein [Halopelagius longus]SDR03187.1 hypothetical protein SAMN05216278_3353 [Halopelagius longus]
MPAFGIGSLVFLVGQALVSSFVYSQAEKYGSRSPLVVGVSAFVLGVAAAFVFRTIVELAVIELLIVLLYLVGLRVSKRRSVSG